MSISTCETFEVCDDNLRVANSPSPEHRNSVPFSERLRRSLDVQDRTTGSQSRQTYFPVARSTSANPSMFCVSQSAQPQRSLSYVLPVARSASDPSFKSKKRKLIPPTRNDVANPFYASEAVAPSINAFKQKIKRYRVRYQSDFQRALKELRSLEATHEENQKVIKEQRENLLKQEVLERTLYLESRRKIDEEIEMLTARSNKLQVFSEVVNGIEENANEETLETDEHSLMKII
ncbi:hypothetical protein HK096_002116, partial [Nowakowskiella sp. JEL0078]